VTEDATNTGPSITRGSESDAGHPEEHQVSNARPGPPAPMIRDNLQNTRANASHAYTNIILEVLAFSLLRSKYENTLWIGGRNAHLHAESLFHWYR
jgi:hypothetical protein